MKSFNTQTIAKTGFTKSKAFGLCGTLAIATALLIGAGTVSADETAQPVADTQPTAANVYTADNGGNVTVTPSETVVETPAVFTPPAPVESQPIATEAATTTEVAQPAATSVVKEGDTITVENPNVEVTFPNGNGKYSPFEVEYKDIKIPDDVPVLDLPELEIPVEPEKPSTPKEVPSKPVEVPKEKVAQPATVSYNFAPTSKETPKTTVYGGVLPNTGEKEGIASTLGLVVIAAGITGLTLGFKKRNEKED